jgi:hypothetical protein
MDYAMPRADDFPVLGSALYPVPCRSNALDIKGVGEAGTTASLAAVMNAVADALPETASLDMPASPARVWRAIKTSDLGRKGPSTQPSPRERRERGEGKIAWQEGEGRCSLELVFVWVVSAVDRNTPR